MGTRSLKPELPTWGCLSPRSCRPEQGSPPPVARGAAQRVVAHSRGAGDREGETPAASGRPRLTPVTGLPGLPSSSRPVPSGPLPSASALGRAAGGREPRAARLTGQGQSRAPEARGSERLGRSQAPAPPGVPAGRARRAGPASLTRPAAVGAHVAAPEPLRHGSRFTCREPRDGRGGGCASALTGPRAALAAALPSQRLAAPAHCARAERRPAESCRSCDRKGHASLSPS